MLSVRPLRRGSSFSVSRWDSFFFPLFDTSSPGLRFVRSFVRSSLSLIFGSKAALLSRGRSQERKREEQDEGDFDASK